MTARPDEVVAEAMALELHRLRDQADRFEMYGICGAAENIREAASKIEAALQSANARLAAVLALADEIAMFSGVSPRKWQIKEWAEELRRAAAGEGDANQGDGE